MTIPGRAVKMLIFTLFAARSTSTDETPACPSFCFTNFFRRRSSCSHFEKSFSEYHFELQPRMTPSRKPTGCVFCPIKSTFFSFISLSRGAGEGQGGGSLFQPSLEGCGYSAGTSTTIVTCDVRLLMRLARPIDRGIQRFCTGPPSTLTLVTTSLSESAFSFSVALAIAEP